MDRISAASPLADEGTHTSLLSDQGQASAGSLSQTANEKDDECAPLLSPSGTQSEAPSADDSQLSIFQTAKDTGSKEGKKCETHLESHSKTEDHLPCSTNVYDSCPSHKALSGLQKSQKTDSPLKMTTEHTNSKLSDSCSVPENLSLYGSIQIFINDCKADKIDWTSGNGEYSSQESRSTTPGLETLKMRKTRRRRWNQLGKYSPSLTPHHKVSSVAPRFQ